MPEEKFCSRMTKMGHPNFFFWDFGSIGRFKGNILGVSYSFINTSFLIYLILKKNYKMNKKYSINKMDSVKP